MYAQIAADMAAETSDQDRRALLLQMADMWRALAEREDGRSRGVQQKPDDDKQ
jgi:hypothetical protein